LAGWFFVVFRGQDPTLVHLVALPYALLLASTAGLGSGLARQDRRFIPLALGGALRRPLSGPKATTSAQLRRSRFSPYHLFPL